MEVSGLGGADEGRCHLRHHQPNAAPGAAGHSLRAALRYACHSEGGLDQTLACIISVMDCVCALSRLANLVELLFSVSIRSMQL